MINNIKLNKLKRQITDLIYEKHLNKYEQYKLNYFIEEYKKLDNDKTPFAYIALAKHYLSIGNINLAEENIKKDLVLLKCFLNLKKLMFFILNLLKLKICMPWKLFMVLLVSLIFGSLFLE